MAWQGATSDNHNLAIVITNVLFDCVPYIEVVDAKLSNMAVLLELTKKCFKCRTPKLAIHEFADNQQSQPV